jgi:hypothetical protein
LFVVLKKGIRKDWGIVGLVLNGVFLLGYTGLLAAGFLFNFS